MRNHPLFVFAIIAFTLGVVCLPTASFAQVAGFSDVPANHWAAESVRKVVAAGIMQGEPSKRSGKGSKSTFDGNKPVTRYELAVTLYRFVQALENANAQKKSKMGADITGPEAVKYLVDNGYLMKNTPLAKDGAKVVTANELADATFLVVAKIKEKTVPISPGSKYAPN